MRSQKLILGVALILLVTLFTPGTNGYSEIHDAIKIEPVSTHSPSDSSDLNVTWTSREQLAPQPLENSSVITGDHVILNATFSENPSFGNITRSRMHIWDGILFESTQPLVNFTNIFPDGLIDAADLSWVIIQGFEIGDQVNITCNFTNSDSDFFAWDGLTDPDEFYYGNNLLRMATNNTPESYSFVWTSTSDIMQLGCMNYDEAPSGNWTVYLEAGNHVVVENNGTSVDLDTYYFDSEAQSYDMIFTAYNELNETIDYVWEDIEICNFFQPEISSLGYQSYDDLSFNFTWTSEDQNQDDVNYYSIWLSNNMGESYMLLAQNLTKTSYFWNSTGWLAGSYLARVRAYSVDCSSPECSLDNPPLSYWPGDFSDAITPQFQAGDVPHSIPPNSFTIDASISANDSYQFGSTNNVISVHVVVNGTHDFLPEHIYYSITDNGSFWFDGELAVITYDDFYTINVDGLSIGEHNLSIRIRDWWSTKYFDVTLVVIGPNSTVTTTTGNQLNWNLIIQPLVVGISLGSGVIIAMVIFLTLRLRRNRGVLYV